MANNSNRVVREALLQEGVSCARATLHAITGAALLNVPPADEDEARDFNHALWLLAMLEDHLADIQGKVDVIDAAAAGDQA